MFSTTRDVLSSLLFWEIAGYISTAIVILGCIGEYIAEFTCIPKSEGEKHRISKLSLIILIAGIAGELLTAVRSSQISEAERLRHEPRHVTRAQETCMSDALNGTQGQPLKVIIFRSPIEARTYGEEITGSFQKTLGSNNVKYEYTSSNETDSGIFLQGGTKPFVDNVGLALGCLAPKVKVSKTGSLGDPLEIVVFPDSSRFGK